MTAMARLGILWNSIQTWLFPRLEDEMGQLDEPHRDFVAPCEFCDPRSYLDAYRSVGNGCPPASRLALWKVFIAKAVGNLPTTRDLIEALRHRPALRPLCGWDNRGEAPPASTLARAFAAFAEDELPQRIHQVLIRSRYG